jgi:hypothetical protein
MVIECRNRNELMKSCILAFDAECLNPNIKEKYRCNFAGCINTVNSRIVNSFQDLCCVLKLRSTDVQCKSDSSCTAGRDVYMEVRFSRRYITILAIRTA